MQVTPLFMFLLLVFLLLFAVLFRWTVVKTDRKEGFVALNYGENTDFSTPVYISQYGTNSLYQIYDAYYFDPANGNLVEVIGPIHSSTEGFETSGSGSGSVVDSATADGSGSAASSSAGSGYGSSAGSSAGSGYGSAAGSGYGSAAGSSAGSGYGSAAGSSTGSAAGSSAGSGYGSAAGSGYGSAAGSAAGSGYGSAAGSGYGSAAGSSTGSGSTGSGSGSTVTLNVDSVNVYARTTGLLYNNTSIVIPQTNQLNYWTHNSKDSQPAENPTVTMIFYFAWNTDTYIHTMIGSRDLNMLTNYSTTRVNGDDTGSVQSTNYSLQNVRPTSTPAGGNVNSGTFAQLNGYPNQVYMISTIVGFDIANGNLVLTNLGPTPIALNRIGNAASANEMSATSISDTASFKPFMKAIDTNNNLVLYMPGQNGNTLIVILNSDLTIFSVTGFTPEGVWSQGSTLNNTYVGFGYNMNLFDIDNTFNFTNNGSNMNNREGSYAYWLAYWNSMNGQSKPTYSEDYLLKTQVVPPVCPTCPNCNSNACNGGTCSNCGGNGGGGTLVGKGANNNLASNTRGVVNNLVDTTGELLGDTGSGIYNLADKSLNLAGQGVGSAADLAKQGVTGTVGLAKDTVGGAVGLAKETVGGAVGLLREAGAGVKDVLTPDGNGGYVGDGQGRYAGDEQLAREYRGQSGQNGGFGMAAAPRYNTAGADPYSYYGALTSRGDSNYIPITTSFSAFSK